MSRTSSKIRTRWAKVRPPGNRILGELVVKRDKATKFKYYGWELWIPNRYVTRVADDYTAPAWAIDTAKDYITNGP